MSEIGIDYTPAYEQGGGIGRYVRELVASLLQQPDAFHYRLLVSGAKRETLPFPATSRFSWHPNRITPQWWARIWHRARVPFPVEALVGRVDLFHATDFVLPPLRARSLLTVHDLSFVRVPDAASPSLRQFLDAVVPRSVRRADHILADSIATKRDLIELYGTPDEKITVLYSGVDTRFAPVADLAMLNAVRAKYQLPDAPFIFSVGTVQPRKNYERLVRALAVLRDSGMDVQLVIAGGRGWLEDGIYRAVRETKLDEYVRFAGFVDDADLPALYSAATVTAVPSLYEGFGIPVLESMACGTPVLTSNVSSLPEVAGDAAISVTPTNLDEMVDGLQRLITDAALREVLIQRGFERTKSFTWQFAANQLRGVYRSLL